MAISPSIDMTRESTRDMDETSNGPMVDLTDPMTALGPPLSRASPRAAWASRTELDSDLMRGIRRSANTRAKPARYGRPTSIREWASLFGSVVATNRKLPITTTRNRMTMWNPSRRPP